MAYYADQPTPGWPGTEADLVTYLTGTIVGTYQFGPDGLITGATYAGSSGDLVWDALGQKFTK
jgi:hypothetical protein